MGATAYDLTAKERRLDERYTMTTPEGVRLFIEEIPKLRLLAQESYYEAVIMLVDFERAIEIAALSERQVQVLKLCLLDGYTQQETAEILNVSRQRVAELTALAAEKVAQIYLDWAMKNEGYELPKHPN